MPDTNFPKPGREFDAGHVPITEEFDSAKRTLPPVAPLAVALVVVVVFIVGVAYIFRSKPVAQGQIDQAFAMQQADNPYSMVLMQVTLRNIGDKTAVHQGNQVRHHDRPGRVVRRRGIGRGLWPLLAGLSRLADVRHRAAEGRDQDSARRRGRKAA